MTYSEFTPSGSTIQIDAAAPALVAPPVQTGPAYVCFICGAPARGLRYWPTGGGWSPLDAYAAHIAYEVPTCICHKTHPGCTRVAMLNGAITPLHFATSGEILDWHLRTAANIGAVQTALAYLERVAETGGAQ